MANKSPFGRGYRTKTQSTTIPNSNIVQCGAWALGTLRHFPMNTSTKGIMSRQLTTLTILFCLVNSIFAAEDSRPALNAEQVKFYIDQVAPILVNNCFGCHGPGSSVKGELYLGNRQDILKGGETGPSVDLENPMDSLLIQAMLYQNMEMPPKGKLPQSQIDIIVKWISNDLQIPPDRETERPVAPKSKYKTEINDETKSLWQHQSVEPSKTPAVNNRKWPTNKIDHYVLSK